VIFSSRDVDVILEIFISCLVMVDCSGMT